MSELAEQQICCAATHTAPGATTIGTVWLRTRAQLARATDLQGPCYLG